MALCSWLLRNVRPAYIQISQLMKRRVDLCAARGMRARMISEALPATTAHTTATEIYAHYTGLHPAVWPLFSRTERDERCHTNET